MVFPYQAVDQSGRLSQGEILFDVGEPLLKSSDEQLADSHREASYTVVQHEIIVVVTPDCDLLNDYFHRYREGISGLDDREERRRQSNLLGHVLCCDVYERDDLKSSLAAGSDIWKRVERNQDERFRERSRAESG